MPQPQAPPPFWKDEIDFQSVPSCSLNTFWAVFKVYRIMFSVTLLLFGFWVLYLLSPSYAIVVYGILLVIVIPSLYRGFYLRKRLLNENRQIIQIQNQAQAISGAILIGSAVHVAGHPQLEREQSIVLGLTQTDLMIYSYASNDPLARIPLQQIISTHTVVYDDDRIPHIEVVDSTAQALQFVIEQGNQEIICLFRSMKKIRPIDWYHAIQKAKVNHNPQV